MRMRKRYGPLLLVWFMIALTALIGCQPKNAVIPGPGTVGGGPAIGVNGTGTIIGQVQTVGADGTTKVSSSGARVVVIDAKNNVFGANGEILTDVVGNFIVNGVAPGQAKISASQGAFTTDPNSLTVVNVSAGQTTTIKPLLLVSGVISGKVQILNADQSRTGQGGATVRAVPSTAPNAPAPSASATTTDSTQLVTTSSDDGSFSFTNVKPGSYTLTATFLNSGNQTLTSNPSIVSVTTGVALAPTLLLQANITTTRDVFGKVVDVNNNPLAGASVKDKLTSVTTTTASDGTFKLTLTIGPKDLNPRSVSIQKAGARFAQDKALDINAGIPGSPTTFPLLTFLDNVLNFTGQVVNQLNPNSPVKAAATITVVGNSTISTSSNPADGSFVLSGIPQADNLLLQADGVTGFLKGTAQFLTLNFLRTNNPPGYTFSTDPATGITTVTGPNSLSYLISADGTTISIFKIAMRPVGSVQIAAILKDDLVNTEYLCPDPYGGTKFFQQDNKSVFVGANIVHIVITDPQDGTSIVNESLTLPATPTEDVKCIPQGGQSSSPVVVTQKHVRNVGQVTRIDNVPGGTQIISATAQTTINKTGIEVKVPAGDVIVAPLITLELPGSSAQTGDVTGTTFFQDNFGTVDQSRKLSWVSVDQVSPQRWSEGGTDTAPGFSNPNPYGRQPVTFPPLVVTGFATQSSCPGYVSTFVSGQGGGCDNAHKPLSERTGVNPATGLDTWVDLNNDGIENDLPYPPDQTINGTALSVQNVNQLIPPSSSGHGYMLLSSDFNGDGVVDDLSADTHTGNRSTTDNLGSFTLHNVIEGSNYITAYKPGYLPKKLSLNNVVGGQVNVAPIFGITPIAGSVSGQVFQGAGVTSPLAAVTVTADPGTATAQSLATDSQGFFVFLSLTSGTHSLQVTVNGVTQTKSVVADRSKGLSQQDFNF